MDAILQLDVDERIRIVQIIWDGIAASVDTMPLTVAEQATIEQLVAEDEAAPGSSASRRRGRRCSHPLRARDGARHLTHQSATRVWKRQPSDAWRTRPPALSPMPGATAPRYDAPT